MSVRLSSAPHGSERHAARRWRRRRRVLIAASLLGILFLTGVMYELNQPFIRISHVQIFGADQSLATFALDAMQGSYLGIVPRNSIFFYPGSHIRESILATNPNFAALSIFRDGLTGLSIRIDNRTAVARWCGLAPTIPTPEVPFDGEYCYVFDASGLVYAAFATTTETINTFKLYAPLEGNTEEPLRAILAQAEKLPAAFDFAREITTLGSPVTEIVVRDGEVDDYLVSGTRITYVFGNEENAFTALVSAGGNYNLADGSIDYIDLRFDGKVYLKRRNDKVQ